MNKTVNINLGGMFFHIDEDAYQKLTRYFDAIKRSLTNSNGQDEIIKDIEMRIAELVSEKHTNEKQVINIIELDQIIAVMGQPEDYRIDNDDEEVKKAPYVSNENFGQKKLYRDKDGAMIGGVLSGLGYYFGIDKVWLRVLFLVCVFFYGTGILAYIILWIVMPEARSTTEKFEMKGEPITISNIEKKVREEYESVSDKIKNTDFDKMGNQVKNSANRIGGSFGDFILTVLKIFAKILGAILIITSLSMLISLLIGVFTLGSGAFIEFPWQSFIEAGTFDYPIWTFGLLMFLVIGIPFFFLLLLGFKLLSSGTSSIGNPAKYALLAIWIIAVALVSSLGIQQATAFATNGRVVQKENINLVPTDTLQIKFKNNDLYSKDGDFFHSFKIKLNAENKEVLYSNNVSIRIESTDDKIAYLQIEKEAKGKNLTEAKQRAEKINYEYSMVGNQLLLDNYLTTDVNNKYRDQEIELTLYLPKGTVIKPDDSMRNFDRTDGDYFLWHPGENEIYKIGKNHIDCINCPADENDDQDQDVNIQTTENVSENDTVVTTTVKVNGETVNVNTSKKTEGLTTNKEGIIIKTK